MPGGWCPPEPRSRWSPRRPAHDGQCSLPLSRHLEQEQGETEPLAREEWRDTGQPLPSWPTPPFLLLRCGGGLPRVVWCRIRPCSQGGGAARPPAQEGRVSPEGRKWTHPGPPRFWQTDSTADSWSEGRTASPPLWGRGTWVGWEVLLGSWPCAQIEREGEPPGCRDAGVRQERGQRQGQLLPRRDPREDVKGARSGTPRREDWQHRRSPSALEPSERAAGPWEHHEGAEPPRGDARGPRDGATASMLGPPVA